MGALVFGTAALGLPYGLTRAGETPALMPDAYGAALIEEALRSGIDVFDTAPAYGVAEERIGRALAERGRVWTKLAHPAKIDSTLADRVLSSLENSLLRLRRPTVDLLQWHNWTADLEASADFRACWARLGADGRVESLGASTYGTVDALAAVESGLFHVVQVEWNILNQGVVDAVEHVARRRGVSLAVRSVFLQGALTDEPRDLPRLPTLLARVERAARCAREVGLSLRDLALRGALGHEGVSYVLMGIDRIEQIADAVRVAQQGPLGADASRAVGELSDTWDPALDPRTWAAATSS